MPLNSMTAYGLGENSTSAFRYSCEIRTLNSRYLEVNARLPRALIALEPEVINMVKGELKRGRVDLFVEMKSLAGGHVLPQLNVAALTHYRGMADEIQRRMGDWSGFRAQGLSVSDLMRLEGVLEGAHDETSVADQLARHRETVFGVVRAALADVKKARAREGLALRDALRALLDELIQDHKVIEAQAPEILAAVHTNYVKRVRALFETIGGDAAKPSGLTEERLAIEVGILTDKADVAEELTRLGAHEVEFQRLLSQDDAVGRELDFMCQELHREVNTLGNKLLNPAISPRTVHMKQTVERLRQQVQNIE
jgi:uncharacterized protein (TIGR00255 family)